MSLFILVPWKFHYSSQHSWQYFHWLAAIICSDACTCKASISSSSNMMLGICREIFDLHSTAPWHSHAYASLHQCMRNISVVMPKYFKSMMTSSNGSIFRVTGPLWRGALMICAWINGWVNNRETGDLRRHQTHHDVIVMCSSHRP